MKLPTIHQIPFLRMLLPMIVGILVYSLYPQVWPAYLFGGVSVLFLLYPLIPLSAAQSYRFNATFGIGVFLAFFALGIYLSDQKAEAISFDFPIGKTFGIAEITSQPEEKDRSIACYIKVLEKMDSSGCYHSSQKLLNVYFHKDQQSLKLKQGDKVRFCAEVKPLINTNRPGGFDYAAYLHQKGISGSAYIDSAYWKKIPGARPFNLHYLANDLRNLIIETFRSFHFGENEFALLTATTIGYTDELSPEQKGNFSAVGLSHLMAVSGMQTAMIFAMVMFLLGFIPKNSKLYRIKFIITLVILWIFTFITGLSPSVVRSSIMLTVFLIGGLTSRSISPFNSLAFSAFCILFYNPMTLFDIGFQLSYAAVISILIAQAFLSDSINKKKTVPRYIYNLLLMTLVAQLGTSPLSIYYFHQFPLLFLIVNLIVLPLSGIQVYLSVGCLILAAIGVPYDWFGNILEMMLRGLDYLTRYFADFSFAQVRNLNPSLLQVICLYIILISGVSFMYKKRFKPMAFSLAVIIIFLGISLYEDYQRSQRHQILVYNQMGSTVLECNSGEKNGIYGKDKPYVWFEGQRVILLSEDIRRTKTSSPLKGDIIILTKGFKGEITDLQGLYQFKTVVLSANMSRYYAGEIESGCLAQGLKYHNIGKEGAFVYTLPH